MGLCQAFRAKGDPAVPLQASEEGREGEDSDAELPPEQLLPGMQHLSVAFRETMYTGGDECEGPQGKIERQAQVRPVVLPVHSTCCARARLADMMSHRMCSLTDDLTPYEGHRDFSDHWEEALWPQDYGFRLYSLPVVVPSTHMQRIWVCCRCGWHAHRTRTPT